METQGIAKANKYIADNYERVCNHGTWVAKQATISAEYKLWVQFKDVGFTYSPKLTLERLAAKNPNKNRKEYFTWQEGELKRL